MHKKLIIISQRAQAVDVNARGNVTWFYKCTSFQIWFLPKFFRVYMTDEIDEGNNYPIWVRHNSQGEETWKAPVYHSGFARQKIYDLYDSWYMRKNMKKSQEVHVNAYEVSFAQKVSLFFKLIGKKKQPVHKVTDVESKPVLSHAPTIEPIPERSIRKVPVLHVKAEAV